LIIAVDAMGGDRAPDAVIEGALRASAEPGVEVLLVGPAGVLHEGLRRRDTTHAALNVVDAPDVVGMDEAPLAAFRRKPRSSIRVAAGLVASGEADACFSAGHSGAACLAAQSAFGLLTAVDRPALAVTMPTISGLAILLDAGANPDCRPHHLLQFAEMGAAYARAALELANAAPRVALLSIGEEAGKGNDLTREAHTLLRDTTLNYIGNVDAREMFSGRADVIVCDGFTGNVALKVGEGVVEAIQLMLREELDTMLFSQIGALLTRRAFARFRQRVDYAEYGAAPLLGVRRLALIAHGRSSPRAIESGIALAARLAAAGIVDQLAAALEHER
jgi:glycerol-3-phosphate acyltransferase PlsX